MRVVIIGARGQLGSDLCRRLRGQVIGLGSQEVDVRGAASVELALRRRQPDAVINCAALTNVDMCEERPEEAFAVNASGAGHVARVAKQVGAAVVYVSTDYVFGADEPRSEPYTEEDLPGPINVYGASKLAGEHLTRAYNERSYIVRTCGLYGVAGSRIKGGNFVETMLRLGRQQKHVQVACDQRVSPTSTWEVAGKIASLIETGAYGLYHVAAADSCSWCEFAEAIFTQTGMAVTVQPVGLASFARQARRPVMSALRSERLERVGLEPCRTWRAMLREYLESREACGRLCGVSRGASGRVWELDGGGVSRIHRENG